MGKKSYNELKEKIISFYNDNLNELFQSYGIKSYKKLITLWIDFHSAHVEAADSVLQKYSELFIDDKNSEIEKIEAQSIIVEIIDQKTGKLFRRNLPIKYIETDNGVILSGETSEGKSTNITLLSDTALARIRDLTGKGPDKPRCDH